MPWQGWTAALFLPPSWRLSQDDVTREVIEEQNELGVGLVTDGQVRWLDEVTYVAGKLAGVSLGKMIRWFDTNTYFREPVVESRIAWQGCITAGDYAFARSVSSVPVKVVLPGPYTLAKLSRDEAYGDLALLALAYAEALNREALELESQDPPLIQFNEPAITQHPEDIAVAEAAWRRLLQGLRVESAVYLYFGPHQAALPTAIDCGFVTVGIDATIPGAVQALRQGPLPAKLGLGAVDARVTRMESPSRLARSWKRYCPSSRRSAFTSIRTWDSNSCRASRHG